VLNFDAVLLSECLLVLTYPSYGLLKLAGLGQILYILFERDSLTAPALFII